MPKLWCALPVKKSKFSVVCELGLKKFMNRDGIIAEANVNCCEGSKIFEILLVEHFLDDFARRGNENKLAYQTQKVRRSLVRMEAPNRVQFGRSVTYRSRIYPITLTFPVNRGHYPLLHNLIDISHPLPPISLPCYLRFSFRFVVVAVAVARALWFEVCGLWLKFVVCGLWRFRCSLFVGFEVRLKRPRPALSVLDMWGRIKGQVNWTKEDQDASDDDTILSRALLRYYAPEIPPWLASAKGAEEFMRVSPQATSSYSQTTSQYSLSSAQPQSYSRRGSSVDGPRKFERSGSFAAPSASEPQPRAAPKHSASGLVSRLKNTNW